LLFQSVRRQGGMPATRFLITHLTLIFR
jgi:hypothetical protein